MRLSLTGHHKAPETIPTTAYSVAETTTRNLIVLKKPLLIECSVHIT